jgi:nicotinic acid phosphoribosyltransferase
MYINPAHATDGYKTGHISQYPDKTELVYSNFTCRSNKLAQLLPDFDGKTVFFGLQGMAKWLLIDLWNKEFFQQPKEKIVAAYKRRMDRYLGEGAVPVEHIAELHDLGYLPIEIKALPEGSRVNSRVPVMTIKNTLPRFAWLTNYLESQISAELWKSIRIATVAYEYRRLFDRYADLTGSPKEFVPFQGHDFSFRGMSGIYDGASHSAGHLLSFLGTDTIASIDYLEQYYGAEDEFVGASVPATEHSVMCMGGKETEIETFRRLLTKVYPKGIVSIVSDTWNFWQVITEYASLLQTTILSRGVDAMGFSKVVFRPDCYDGETEILTENGWVKFPDLQRGTKVAQMHDDWTTDFVEPIKYIEQDYTGEMIALSGNKIDLLVTPNHRMILSDHVGRLTTKEASSASFHDKNNIPRVAPAKAGETHLKPFEQFLIAFQADGSFPSGFTDTTGRVCGHIRTRFNFQKKRKIERLIEICKAAGFDYDINQEPKRGVDLDQVTFYVNIPLGTDAARFLSKEFGWVKPLKRDFTWCDEFVREVGHWDGSYREDGKGRIKYDTTVPYNAEIIQLVAIRGGWGCTYGIYRDDRSEEFSDVHSLSITTRYMINGQGVHKESVDYSGKVYCVQVPTGRLVVRRNRKIVVCGNSGDPVKIIAGDPEALVGSPEYKGAVECLWDVFGGTYTSTGHKLLDSHVGVIYGDSITLSRALAILEALHRKGFASANVVFGIGSYTYQMCTRDSHGMAIKSTFGVVDGEDRILFKDPITDHGSVKKSAMGLLRVEYENGDFVLYDNQTWEEENTGCLKTVFLDSQMIREEKLSDLRGRLLG